MLIFWKVELVIRKHKEQKEAKSLDEDVKPCIVGSSLLTELGEQPELKQPLQLLHVTMRVTTQWVPAEP